MKIHYIVVVSIIIAIKTIGQVNINQIKHEFVKIPAGPFLRTINNDTSFISYDYKITTTEITNKQYLTYLNEVLINEEIEVVGNRVIGNTINSINGNVAKHTYIYYKDNPVGEEIFNYDGNRFTFTEFTLKVDHPVIYITWFGANAFAKHYGYRLPTNKEWEKAAKGMIETTYSWGDSLDNKYANYLNSGDLYDNGTTPVKYYNGEKKDKFETSDNSSIYGVYDMLGNVSEWTKSNSKRYPEYIIYRGGSWFNKKENLSHYITSEGGKELATEYIGFRCVK